MIVMKWFCIGLIVIFVCVILSILTGYILFELSMDDDKNWVLKDDTWIQESIKKFEETDNE